MGCAVNGPGEAGDADFGIAGGRDVGFVYAHGRVLKKVSSDILDRRAVLRDRPVDRGRHAAPEAPEDGEAGRARDGRSLADPARLACQRIRDSARLTALPADAARRPRPTPRRVCHKLLVRGGFIRQVAAGLWTFLPLGWHVHQKVVQIIREEMNAIGGQELLVPVLTPRELWEATGRDEIPEVFQLEDRNGRHFVLPLTHEETFTFHAREIQSYKELPQLWYHFQTKDRDEPRPRGGLLRVREFIMKDAYSFDRDEEGARRQLRASTAARTTGSSSAAARGARGAGGERDHGRRARRSTSSRRPARARTRS